MSARKALIVLTVFGMFLGSVTAAQEYRFVKMWPEVPIGWNFYRPRSVATDKAGNVYVLDSGNYRIKKFDSKGRLLTQWGSAGKGEGKFANPWKMGVDSSGVVYVGDWRAKDHRIQKFTSDGRFISEWRSEVLASAGSLGGLALDSHGNLFVVEYAACRIAKFAPDGKLVAQWGGKGDGDGEFSQPWSLAVDASDNVYVADTQNHRVQKFDSTGKSLMKWGSFGEDEGLFVMPVDIAVSPSGDVYVASRGAIQRFTPEGKFLARWKTSLAAPVPRHIAVDSSGKVYQTNYAEHCVDVFDSDGKLIETWGSVGTGAGKFDEPGSIAVGPSDQVVVADAGSKRVQSFDSDGRVLARWGTGFSPGFVAGLAIDGSGNIYTTGGSEVRKFDAAGRPVAVWGEEGSGDGQLKGVLWHVLDVAADASGNVYVADKGNHRVQKFGSDGRFLTKWGSEGTDDGQFANMGLIAVNGSGDICVADSLESGETRIQKFRPDGQFVTRWTIPGTYVAAMDLSDNVYNVYSLSAWRRSLSAGRSDGVIQKYDGNGKLVASFGKYGQADDELRAWLMCADASGNTYFPEPGAQGCVKKFDSKGKFVGRWVLELSSERFVPAAIAADKAGMVYVADWSSLWIQKLNPEGKPAGKFRLGLPATEGKFQRPGGVAFDASGNIYVVDSVDVDSGDPRIQKFDSKGEFITQWKEGLAEDKVQHPASMALDRSGNAYITDKRSHCVHKFDLQGKCIKEWGFKGKEDGQFDDPEGIAVDEAGNVYVCDRQNCRLQKFDSEGKFLAKWGKEGSADGEFHFPAAVALDKGGNVYVADSDNNRVQKFTAEGKFLTAWGEFGEAPGQFSVPLGIAVDAAGNVYVSDSHNHRIQKFAPASSR